MKSDSRTKKEELKTYSSLQLKRTLKSASQKRRLIARGAQVILGSGQPNEPEITVRRDQYMEMRMTVLAEQLHAAKANQLDLSREVLLDWLAPTVERETYARLLLRAKTSSRLESAFFQTHARHPTQAEQKIFHQQTPPPRYQENSSNAWREDLLEHVLGAIEEKRQNSTGRLQTVWAEVVGAEVAQQSSLEKVEGGIAWFRCLSSALSYQLQRKADLPKKLSTKMRQPVRQVRASY